MELKTAVISPEGNAHSVLGEGVSQEGREGLLITPISEVYGLQRQES